jgi:hypothetical protein
VSIELQREKGLVLNPTKGTFLDDLLFAGVVPSPGKVWILGNEDEGAQGGMGTLAIHTTTGK